MNLCWTIDYRLFTVEQVEIIFAFIPIAMKAAPKLFAMNWTSVTHQSFFSVIFLLLFYNCYIYMNECVLLIIDSFFSSSSSSRTVHVHVQCITIFALLDLHLWIIFVAPTSSQPANLRWSDILNDSPRHQKKPSIR